MSRSRPRPPPPPPPRADDRAVRRARAPRTFTCDEDLWRGIEARARALECSIDWIVAEALKRLLESASVAAPAKPDLPAPTPPPPPRRTLPSASLAFSHDGRTTPIVGDRFVIGRNGRRVDLALRDPAVSRQHAIVERHGADHVIVDVASANGVFVNQRRIARTILRPGDVVEIGPFELTVSAST